MPCDAIRLLRLRFRGYGDDVARAAASMWEGEAPALAAEPPAPLDARAWLSAWPALALAAPALEAQFEPVAKVGEDLPAPMSPLYEALQQLQGIDPLSLVLCVDAARGTLDPTTFRSGLGLADEAFANQLALASFRALVLLTGALDRIEPRLARVCAAARWFGPSRRSEVTSLARAREIAEDGALTMTAFRQAAGEGVTALLAELQRDPRVGVVISADAIRAFRRALSLDAEGEELAPYEEPLFAWLARRFAEAEARGADAHPPPAELIAFASSAALPSAQARRSLEHLLSCRDDRCGAIVRAEVMGMASVRHALSGPTAGPSSWPVRAPGPLLGLPLAPAPQALSDDEEDTLPRK